MENKHECDHKNCTGWHSNQSVCQTLSEMDWERGLWNAAFSGDKERVLSLLAKAKNTKVAVNAPDNSGYTSLHYAARNGHKDICNILLQYGACINAQTRTGNATPLHKAAAAEYCDTSVPGLFAGLSILRTEVILKYLLLPMALLNFVTDIELTVWWYVQRFSKKMQNLCPACFNLCIKLLGDTFDS